jgi:para-nitrobenzyl esterase
MANLKRLSSCGVALGAIVMTAACSSSSSTTSDPTVVTTTHGNVQGGKSADGAALQWLGVPFAKPPTAANGLRWAPPVDPVAWTGTLPTQGFADACAQPGTLYGPTLDHADYSTLADSMWTPVGSEDCLYLNVWRPAGASASARLPVLVFIHGGSNRAGNTDDPMYSGARFAATENVVFVSIAYRLNLFGTLLHPDLVAGKSGAAASGNWGILDLIKGLEFVKKNIAAFGGDPGNVTISGQSAGGQQVNALLMSPLAAGLFHKAVLMSAPYYLPTPTAVASLRANLLVQKLIIRDDLAADYASAAAYQAANLATAGAVTAFLNAHSTSQIVQAQVDAAVAFPDDGTPGYNPTLGAAGAFYEDGAVLPAPAVAGGFGWYDALVAGTYNKVPLIFGTTADEGKLFIQPALRVNDPRRFRLMMGFDPDGTNPLNLTLSTFLNGAVFGNPADDAALLAAYDNWVNQAGLSALLGVGATALTSDPIYGDPLANPAIYSPSTVTLASTVQPVGTCTASTPCTAKPRTVASGLSTPVFHNLVYYAASLFQAQTGAPPVYLYSFNWKRQPQPWRDLYGTPHVLDVPFAFGNMIRDSLFGCFYSTANKPGRDLLSMAVMDTIGAFVRSPAGDPTNARLTAALGAGNTWKQASGATPAPITSGGTLSVLLPGLTGTPKMLRFDADDTSLQITADP